MSGHGRRLLSTALQQYTTVFLFYPRAAMSMEEPVAPLPSSDRLWPKTDPITVTYQPLSCLLGHADRSGSSETAPKSLKAKVAPASGIGLANLPYLRGTFGGTYASACGGCHVLQCLTGRVWASAQPPHYSKQRLSEVDSPCQQTALALWLLFKNWWSMDSARRASVLVKGDTAPSTGHGAMPSPSTHRVRPSSRWRPSHR